MATDDLPTPFQFADTPTTADQLGSLCRAQQKRIASLSDERERLLTANRKLTGELLEASEARATALVSLTHAVAQGRELCHRLVHERDTALAALRNVVDVTKRCSGGGTPKASVEEVDRAFTQAEELLRLVDQLQAAQARVDARKK